MLNRNEKGQFVSGKTNTPSFEETIKTLEEQLAKAKADKAAADQKAAEEAKAKRKSEAAPVEAAIDAYEEAKVKRSEAFNDAGKQYKAAIEAANKAYMAAIEAAEDVVREAEAKADELRDEFLKTHDQFHYTYRSKDGKYTKNYSYSKKLPVSTDDDFSHFLDEMNEFIDSFFKI